MKSNHKQSLQRLALGVIGLLTVGSVLLYIFEQNDSGSPAISFLESMYFTAIILLTHYDHYGFHDPDARAVVLVLIIMSLVLVVYLLKLFTEYMIGISESVRMSTVKAKVAKMKNHYIVSGYGRVGTQVAQELAAEHTQFVIIDRSAKRVAQAEEAGYVAMQADSSVEGELLAAGIERAKGLIASLGTDSDNLFVTLSARSLNSKLYIVARANRAESATKLTQAGANKVAMPYQIGGHHMASMALRPSVVDYLDIATGPSGSRDLSVQEVKVNSGSNLVGKRVDELYQENSRDISVIAILEADGSTVVRPMGHEVIDRGDTLLMLGVKKDLDEVLAIFKT